MKGLLKAELYNFFHSNYIWIILIVLTICNSISIVFNSSLSTEQMLISINKDLMVILLSCTIYGGLMLTDDYNSGMIKHYIACGYKRSSIIISKMIHYFMGCSILLLLYPFLSFLLSFVLKGVETSFSEVILSMLNVFISVLPLYLGILSITLLFAVLSKKGTVAMAISIPLSIGFVVLSNRFSSEIPFIKYSPIIQINNIANLNVVTSEYWISVLISLFLIAFVVLTCIFKFCKDEF